MDYAGVMYMILRLFAILVMASFWTLERFLQGARNVYLVTRQLNGVSLYCLDTKVGIISKNHFFLRKFILIEIYLQSQNFIVVFTAEAFLSGPDSCFSSQH